MDKFPNDHHKEIISFVLKALLYGATIYHVINSNEDDKINKMIIILHSISDAF